MNSGPIWRRVGAGALVFCAAGVLGAQVMAQEGAGHLKDELARMNLPRLRPLAIHFGAREGSYLVVGYDPRVKSCVFFSKAAYRSKKEEIDKLFVILGQAAARDLGAARHFPRTQVAANLFAGDFPSSPPQRRGPLQLVDALYPCKSCTIEDGRIELQLTDALVAAALIQSYPCALIVLGPGKMILPAASVDVARDLKHAVKDDQLTVNFDRLFLKGHPGRLCELLPPDRLGDDALEKHVEEMGKADEVLTTCQHMSWWAGNGISTMPFDGHCSFMVWSRDHGILQYYEERGKAKIFLRREGRFYRKR